VVGFLSMRSPGESASVEAAFRKGLSEAGYVEGQNVLAAFSECALVRRLRFRHRLPQRQVSFRPAISAVRVPDDVGISHANDSFCRQPARARCHRTTDGRDVLARQRALQRVACARVTSLHAPTTSIGLPAPSRAQATRACRAPSPGSELAPWGRVLSE